MNLMLFLNQAPNMRLFVFVLSVIFSSHVYSGNDTFHPQDLSPDFYAESVATFSNPLTNADCTGFEQPNYCCTGVGTGSCDQPVASFELSQCTTRNLDCSADGVPNACCSGFQIGSCCYEEDDTANGFRGNFYCPTSVCPDGCVSQWVEQSGHKSTVNGHPITGRTFEQDDREKPCYKPNCINGHACVVGHPGWLEPDYPDKEQPKQDATLEIEPADRTGALAECPGAFYLAQLVRIPEQTEDHRLLAGFAKYKVDQNTLQFAPFSGGTIVSVNNVLPQLDRWYFIEMQRYADLTMRLWVNGADKTRSPVPSNASTRAWSTQNLCNLKSCDTEDNQEFQGEAALLLYKCGTPFSTEQHAALQNYVSKTFFSIFADSFEFDNK